jgi:hypothetical protein
MVRSLLGSLSTFVASLLSFKGLRAGHCLTEAKLQAEKQLVKQSGSSEKSNASEIYDKYDKVRDVQTAW